MEIYLEKYLICKIKINLTVDIGDLVVHNNHLGQRSLVSAWTLAFESFDSVPFKMCSLSLSYLYLARTRFPRACRAGATCFPSHSGPLIFTSFASRGDEGVMLLFFKKDSKCKIYLTIISPLSLSLSFSFSAHYFSVTYY